jgi:hypothetical protein
MLPPLKARKDPGVASVIGFLTGGIGLGVYFRQRTVRCREGIDHTVDPAHTPGDGVRWRRPRTCVWRTL